MPWFVGSEHHRLLIRCPMQKARDFFFDPAQFHVALPTVTNTEELEKNVWRLTLAEVKETFVQFTGVYVCEYFAEEKQMTWTTREGNMSSHGKVSVTPRGDNQCEVDYQETIRVELQCQKIFAALIKGVVTREIEKGIQAFLENGKRILEADNLNEPLHY